MPTIMPIYMAIHAINNKDALLQTEHNDFLTWQKVSSADNQKIIYKKSLITDIIILLALRAIRLFSSLFLLRCCGNYFSSSMNYLMLSIIFVNILIWYSEGTKVPRQHFLE
jgi:hypothetical protein